MSNDNLKDRHTSPAGKRISRRTLLSNTAIVGLLGATATFPAPLRADKSAQFGNPLEEFSYQSVELGSGPHKIQFEQTQALMMELDEDSLARPFRLAAGLPAPGFDLGGWYSGTPERFGISPAGPEAFGQWLSALSRAYAATGNKEALGKIDRMVRSYALAVHSTTGNVAGASRAKEYFYDKLVCGLSDVFAYTTNNEARALVKATTQAFDSALSHRAIDVLGPDGRRSFESYTIPENQYIAYTRGCGDAHLKLATQYLADDFLFDPLAAGNNVFANRHAYSHVNALCSAAQAYLVAGNPKHLRAAVNGFRFIEEQSFVTGGWGVREVLIPTAGVNFLDPVTGRQIRIPAYNSLADALKLSREHFETGCGSYAHFKLTRYLLRITRQAHYGDSMERVLYNCALGVLPINKYGKAFYQSDYGKYATKKYFDGYGNLVEDEWPCCSGTLPQLAADYHISTYFCDAAGVTVNLYLPSTLRWRHDGVDLALTQSGNYPLEDTMDFLLEASAPVRFALHMRIPAWAKKPSIEVNGKDIGGVTPETFATIERRWRTGDKVRITLPKRLELKPIDPDHSEIVALVNGPIVLFAIGFDLPKFDRSALLAARQTSAGSPEWKSGAVRFLPWWVIKDEVYTTYHDLA